MRLAAKLPLGGWVWDSTEIALSIALFSLFFTLIYKTLPKVRVSWSAAAQGGLLAGLLWEATRLLLSYLLVGQQYSAYGVVGSLIAVMLWIYIASSILFLGPNTSASSTAPPPTFLPSPVRRERVTVRALFLPSPVRRERGAGARAAGTPTVTAPSVFRNRPHILQPQPPISHPPIPRQPTMPSSLRYGWVARP